MAQLNAGPVRCAVWENQRFSNGRQSAVFSVTVGRNYREKTGAWKTTTSFGRNDIPLLIHCLQKAFEFMLEPRKHSVAEDKGAQEGSVIASGEQAAAAEW